MTPHLDYAAARDLIDSAAAVLVVTHVDPDGDALGSLTAMGQALLQMGKTVTLACDNGMLSRFSYLPLSERVATAPDPTVSYDLVIALDCGDRERTGRTLGALPKPQPPILNIDHHITNTLFGTVNIVIATASSTAEMLLDLFEFLGQPLTRAVATSLLTGIVTDTMSFRTSNVTPRTLAAAGTLVAAGADLHDITMKALLLKPFTTLRLWQLGLNNVQLEDGLIWTAVSRAEQTALGYSGNSNTGIVSFLANIQEASISAVLMERDDGRVAVSFRSREPYQVADVALALGGGGHPLASGCTLDLPLHEAEALVVARCRESLRAQRSQAAARA